MAGKRKKPRHVLPAHRDPIRIVPLHMPEVAVKIVPRVAAPPAPKLTYRGGPLLTAVQVFTVYWGPAWKQASLKPMAGKINTYFKSIVKSSLMTQMAEYNVPQYTIKKGKYVGTATITSPPLGTTVTDSAIQHMLQQEIATNPKFPQPNTNMLYFVYLPPGVGVIQGGGKSCQAFCGYHDNISGQIFYAAMPYPGCAGCVGNLTPFDALTSTSSHELCEAITDAVPGSGWYDDHYGEIGDICSWKTKKVGAYVVQKEWSNAAKACV